MRRRFYIAYAVLLLASWLFAGLFPVREKPTSGQKLITVERPQGCERPTRPVEIAFAELGDASNSVVVLLHGSPVGASLLHRLAQRLSADFRVIVPDLPGFAASTRGLAGATSTIAKVGARRNTFSPSSSQVPSSE